MLDKKPRFLRNTISLFVTLAIIGFGGWLYVNRQFATDQLAVWAYTPSAAVTTIEDRIDLTDKGHFAFRATQPAVETGETFNQSCPRQERSSPILGCYAANRIIILDVTNQELDGIEEVTAAHEMLHAAWDRLSADKQAEIATALKEQYSSLDNADLRSRMAYYERTEPGQFINELHSIIGTEVSSLSPVLETYYSTYFHDRSKVVALHDTYSTVFTSLQNQATALGDSLTESSRTITAESRAYQQASATLASDVAVFNRRATNNEFQSQAEFNQARSALVGRSTVLDQQREDINSMIDQYNQQYETYRTVSSRLQQLNSSIDSFESLQPAPAV